MPKVMIFAPSPLLTVTIEGGARGTELHVHAGGQGVWQSKMLRTLGAEVSICGVLTGESGRVVQHLLEDDGLIVHAVHRDGRGGAYVHDRRSGERVEVVEVAGDPLSRHELDELYTTTIREAMSADLVLLSGPAGDGVLPDDVYRRLASDLTAAGRTVVVDLAGGRLAAALEGGVRLAKVSETELEAADASSSASMAGLIASATRLRDAGARSVVVTRAGRPAVLIDGDEVSTVHAPVMEAVDPSGAGDSFTAALAASLAEGDSLHGAVALAAAAGALNVTRHGLGTGDAEAIRRLSTQVEIIRADREAHAQLSPDELAGRLEVDER